jgi:hypothetical protein
MPTSQFLLSSIAPEIDSSSQQTADMLALAELEVGISLCPDLRPYVVAYLTAHNVTLSNRGGNAGMVTDLREGQLSVSYDSGIAENKNMNPYSQTPYGQKYLQLIKQCVGGVAFRTAVMPWA